MKNLFWPVLIILAIISITLFGGVKDYQTQTATSTNIATPSTPAQQQATQQQIAYNVQTAQYQADQLQQQIAVEQAAKLASQYKGQVTVQWGSYGSTNPNQEYIEIDANSSNKNPVDITGWWLMSTSTGQRVYIPQSTALYFANAQNSVQDVILSPGERAYIVTGRSPIGFGFHTNVCSGYLSQKTSFTPRLYTSCPVVDTSSIPRTQNNVNCLDLLSGIGSCRTYSQTLNNTYSYECQQLVETKFNYQSCVDIHKNDSTFYSPKTWYVYLQRDNILWVPRYEVVTLYDTLGKPVQTISR